MQLQLSDDQITYLLSLAAAHPEDCKLGQLAEELKTRLDSNTDESDNKYREAAQAYAHEGDIEIDEDAPVSRGGDPGAYVQAWIWVYACVAGVTEDMADDDCDETAESSEPAGESQ